MVVAIILFGGCYLGHNSPIDAQTGQRLSKNEATLVVEGVVQQVLASPRPAQPEVVVQIEVQRSDARRAANGRTHFPAPGEVVYVHAALPAGVRLAGGAAEGGAVPAERASIRAYLTPRDSGVWEGVSPDWFEPVSERTASSVPAGPLGGDARPADRANVSSLGMTYEAQTVKDRLVLRVKSVERGGPAQEAGIESGDVIIGIRNNPLQSAGQLDELARNSESLPLMVVDVNTGRPAQVEIRPRTASPSTASTTPAGQAAPRRSLGLSAETVRLGLRTALKVSSVEPGSPAQKAGIEPDDILVAANGASLTSPDQLGAALRKSGSTLTLTVRDSRTGKDVPVEVVIGGPTAPASFPADIPTANPASGALGAVTELSFYDVEVALKVTEVEPGSPAAKAGLQPGDLIIAANGKPMLHPQELNEAVRNSNGNLRLSVVNPRTKAKNTLAVNLSR
jgi:S1-C subfamily serine protease